MYIRVISYPFAVSSLTNHPSLWHITASTHRHIIYTKRHIQLISLMATIFPPLESITTHTRTSAIKLIHDEWQKPPFVSMSQREMRKHRHIHKPQMSLAEQCRSEPNKSLPYIVYYGQLWRWALGANCRKTRIRCCYCHSIKRPICLDRHFSSSVHFAVECILRLCMWQTSRWAYIAWLAISGLRSTYSRTIIERVSYYNW